MFTRATAIVATILVLFTALWGATGATAVAAPQRRADGAIAYVKNGREIWLTAPDGANDRRIWRMPDGRGTFISSLAWRPDGRQLAFSSDHERTCSLFDRDVYVINPDGSGLRRLTNGPSCATHAQYPTGSVTLEVANAFSSGQPLVFYFEGMADGMALSLGPGEVKRLTLTDVADWGPGVLQTAVVIQGNTRWIDPGTEIDVRAGDTVDAGRFTLTNSNKTEILTANQVTWQRDGTAVAFTQGGAYLQSVPANPQPHTIARGQPLLGSGIIPHATHLDWSPVSDDEFLYVGANINQYAGVIFLATAGGSDRGTPLVTLNDPGYGVAWLPDGSGFVAADVDEGFAPSNSNLYLYEFATEAITQLTFFDDELAIFPSVAPDGSEIVFELVAADRQTVSLHAIQLDGSGMRPVAAGEVPAWGALTDSATLPEKIYLPLLLRG